MGDAGVPGVTNRPRITSAPTTPLRHPSTSSFFSAGATPSTTAPMAAHVARGPIFWSNLVLSRRGLPTFDKLRFELKRPPGPGPVRLRIEVR